MTPRSATCSATAIAAALVMLTGSGSTAQAPLPSSAMSTLAGTVVDAVSGNPVAGAVVHLLQTTGTIVDSVRAAADGGFRFHAVPDGTWSIGSTASGYQGTSSAGRAQLTVSGGRPVTDLTIRMRRVGVIEGIVTTGNGEPVIGADIQTVRSLSRGRYAAGPRVTTDDRGMYRVVILTDGDYVVVIPPAIAPVPDGPFGVPGESPASTFLYPSARSTPVRIGGRSTTATVDLVLHATRGVTIGGAVSGPGAAHLAGGDITLRPADSRLPLGLESQRAVVRADGRFVFPPVAPGRYVLSALRSGATPAPDSTVFIEQDVIVGESAHEDLVVHADFGIPVSGTVVFEGDSPRPALAGPNALSVSLQPTSNQASVFLSGRVNPDGSFTTRQVPPRWHYYAFAFAPPPWSFKSATYRGRDISSEALQIVEPLTDPIIITLTDRGPILVGTVRNRQGAGVADLVCVFPVDQAGWTDSRTNRRLQSVTADLAGAFRFERLPAGTYFVAAADETARDHWNDPAHLAQLAQRAVRVTLTEGQTTTADVLSPGGGASPLIDDDDRPRGPYAPPVQDTVTQAAVLSGTVTTGPPPGTPLPGVTVQVRRIADGMTWSAFSDAQGRCLSGHWRRSG